MLARRKGFFLGTPVPIASLRSLPRRRKQSTGLFSSANHRFAPSLFESLNYNIQKNKRATKVTLSFLARRKGFFLGTPVPIASLRSLPRRRKQSTGLFSSANHRFAPSLFESLNYNIQKNKRATKVTLSFLARRKGFEPPTFWFVAATITVKCLF